MTAGTSIATFLLVLILQHTDSRQTKTMQLKLDELLRAVERARNDLIHLEAKPDEQIENLDEEFGTAAEARLQIISQLRGDHFARLAARAFGLRFIRVST
jgi:low affinity Fe/Cu permease